MANGNGQAVTGTFTGDGTSNVSLNIGFEPDVVVITSGLDFSTAGWVGVGIIILVRGVVTANFAHGNATTTSETAYQEIINSEDDEWGASGSAFRPYATYSNGVLNVTNKTTGRDNTILINGQTYTWKAYKT